MKNPKLQSVQSAVKAVSVAGCLALLAACGNDEIAPIAMPAPTPTPTPVPTPTTFDVQACLDQQIPGAGVTVAQAVVPDTLTIDLTQASGFPNGRGLPDPVIDVTLGVIFLDLATNGPATLASLPLNPAANDVAFPDEFPYLAPPQGTPPVTDNTGTSFVFRNNQPSEYVRVDRMGMPAVATALIGSDRRNDYNDADPAQDANGDFVPDLGGSLTALTNALADDLTGAGLAVCATPN